jgi:hypothetical protein
MGQEPAKKYLAGSIAAVHSGYEAFFFIIIMNILPPPPAAAAAAVLPL